MQYKSIRTICAILTLCFMSTLLFASSPLPNENSMDRFISQWSTEHHLSSVVVNIENKANKSHYSMASGYKTHSDKQTVTVNTLYGVGSISKTFAAAALLQLQEQKKINLDESISHYIPEYPRWNKVTIRQLLNMTSGIYNSTESEAFKRLQASQPTHKIITTDLIQIAYEHDDEFQPGKHWKYSNTNYLLAGMIIERVTKNSLATVYQEHFFKPLSLKNTHYSEVMYSKKIYQQMAHVYPNGKSIWAAITEFNPGLWGAAGGMVMDSKDLTTWVHALFTPGVILSKQSIAEMQQTISIGHAPPKPSGARFGLGVYSLNVQPLGTVWWYTGIIGGYTSSFVWIPSKQLIIVAQVASWPADKMHLLFPNEALFKFLLSH